MTLSLHFTRKMSKSQFSMRLKLILVLILGCFSTRVTTLEIVRYYPFKDFIDWGISRNLEDRAFSSNQAGCAASCSIDEKGCIGFAYSQDLKKCVKFYTMADLADPSTGRWKTYSRK